MNLGKNSIGDAGMAKIADALKSNTTLTRLDLRQCGISSVGVVALYDALRSPSTNITHVTLDGNRMGTNHKDKQILDRIDKQLSSNMLSSYLRQIQENDSGLETIDLVAMLLWCKCCSVMLFCLKTVTLPEPYKPRRPGRSSGC